MTQDFKTFEVSLSSFDFVLLLSDRLRIKVDFLGKKILVFQLLNSLFRIFLCKDLGLYPMYRTWYHRIPLSPVTLLFWCLIGVHLMYLQPSRFLNFKGSFGLFRYFYASMVFISFSFDRFVLWLDTSTLSPDPGGFSLGAYWFLPSIHYTWRFRWESFSMSYLKTWLEAL